MAEFRLPTLNKVLVIGRLTRDPDLRYIADGTAVCGFRLAVNRRYRLPSSDTWKDDTTYIDVVTWRKLAERLGETLHKGSPVQVEGRLQSRTWENEAKQKRSTIEIVADRVQNLERTTVKSEEEGEPVEDGETPAWSGPTRTPEASREEESPDDLPF
jgi:single-strand DNA-binding protein